MTKNFKIALVGNPNTGKSTLFNVLTGLNQKVGNFPGITVDKKTGHSHLPDGRDALVIDLPGTYSLYPKSRDESIVLEVLADKQNAVHPDLVVIVADASNLKRNLLLYTQVADLKMPVVIALNMIDVAEKAGYMINIDRLSKRLGVQVVPISARNAENIDKLKEAICFAPKEALQEDTIEIAEVAPGLVQKIQTQLHLKDPYSALQYAHQHEVLGFLSEEASDFVESVEQEFSFNSQEAKAKETIARYNYINEVLVGCMIRRATAPKHPVSSAIDSVLTHRIWGFVLFFGVLMLIFQAIFSWSEYPMTLIEDSFAWMTDMVKVVIPQGVLQDLICNGILAGLSGVLVFIPQIAILFAFISILEDTGYMARITFMLDKVMRKVGLSGRSVVPMVGGLACAVPSIMSTRTIENWKDRMITIMVTPLVSCSARLPIYTILIALVVPDERIWFMNVQGLVLMGLYVLSIVTAVIVAWVMKYILKARERGYFIMELPPYQLPRWRNVLLTMYEKVKTFVLEAGKVIVTISIILWVLASYAPPGVHDTINKKYDALAHQQTVSTDELELHRSSELLENSYAGIMGHAIEPVIRPLGYDWKIGIALITSFAAREVFVGTIATIYSVHSDEDSETTVLAKMRDAKHPDTGLPVFTLATSFSLMIFYAFAMQCMSTLAIVYRETKSWKWPAIQFVYMTCLAYFASLLVYTLLK